MKSAVEQHKEALQKATEAAEAAAQRAQAAAEAMPALTRRRDELRAQLAELQREAAGMTLDWTPEQAGALAMRRMGLESLIETAERQIAQHREVEGEAVKAVERTCNPSAIGSARRRSPATTRGWLIRKLTGTASR